ncbi:Putative ABC transporter [Acididesulfobacillus acetoxydans]|uniref:ABC transporter n=1 Tax=Acididesulfobacillus acetoxydans TaxID=1561005 RepID=A0A8S0WLX2_9FIRM|nr:ABC transporter ATP-binding protein [Acididesulfobacillus acetoxydans]CAA7600224.1 Putative ABC transporter [Acididesulfobacillus acetoxydans]CEJ09602.1 Lipid A export ATP-binding/permease protein MsbA [Acididesulfobacillus acetoxydans]
MGVEFRGLGLGANSGGSGSGGNSRWRLRELANQEHFDWQIIKRVLKAFVPYWPTAILVMLVIFVSAIGNVAPAWLTQKIIDEGILKGRLAELIWLTLTLVGVAIATGLLGVWQNWLSNLIAQHVMADYRLALFRKLQEQTVNFFASTQSGDLVSRVMNDVTAIQNAITTTLVGFVSNLLMIAVTLTLMFKMNWRMSVLAMIVVPAFVIPTQRVGRVRQKLQAEIQEWLSAMTVQLSETLGVSGALLIRMFNREEAEEKKFATANVKLRDLQVRQGLIGRWLFMWLGMFSSIGPALLWGYGGWLVIHHEMELGVIVAFTTLLSKLYGPLSQLAQVHVNVLSSIALFRRIYSVMDLETEVSSGPVILQEQGVRGRIELRGVSYSYPDYTGQEELRPALQEVTLTLEPGQKVALVGPSGAGKTTLLNLIPRFADPTGGSLLLDGVDCKTLSLRSLRAQMGLVPQDPFFFHDTVYNNLRVARENATLEEMEQACRAAQIHDMIADLPQGYQTMVGERGYRLSGGERQRLAIARVLLQGPRIVLLDEATSALDTVVERKIQDALAVLLEGRTALVIAHRLSTVLSADKIVVLNEGRVVAAGKHEELLQTCPLYKELYEVQFGVQSTPEPEQEAKEGRKGGQIDR